MLKKFMVSAMLSLAFAGVVFFSIETSSGPSQGASGQAKQLSQAINDLQHPDKIVRRQAARQLSTLIETPGIQRAIHPLSDLLLNRGTRSGVFTQELAATDLGLIALKLGSPQGGPALDALIECLMTEGYDTVRAAAATALGLTKNELALEPLEFARVSYQFVQEAFRSYQPDVFDAAVRHRRKWNSMQADRRTWSGSNSIKS